MRIFDRLHYARKVQDLSLPGYRLHKLKGDRAGFWAVDVSGNFRVFFKFEDGEAIDVDYDDYHYVEGDAMKRKPTHPGAVFKYDVLEPLGLTVTEAAKKLGVTRKALSEFINEKSSLSTDMAMRISMATGTTPESWMNMQFGLDLWHAEQKDFHVEKFDKKAG